jgi:hypothetical protein
MNNVYRVKYMNKMLETFSSYHVHLYPVHLYPVHLSRSDFLSTKVALIISPQKYRNRGSVGMFAISATWS